MLPALHHTRGSLSEGGLHDRDPPGQRPPGQRSPGQRPPGQRSSWTETPLDRGPPWTETPWTEIPLILTSGGGHCSGRFASYWNAFLYCKSLRSRKPFVLTKPSNFRMHRRHHCLLIAINKNNHEALTFWKSIETNNNNTYQPPWPS